MFSFLNTDKLQFKNSYPVFLYFTVSKIQVPLKENFFLIPYYATSLGNESLQKAAKTCWLIGFVLNNKIYSKFCRFLYTRVSLITTETVLLQTHTCFSSRLKSH